MQKDALDEDQWAYVRTLLPVDLEETARQSKALVRCRKVPDAAALIRMALAYALSDLLLKDVAAWATSLAVADHGPGLFYRLREAEKVAGASPGPDLSGRNAAISGRMGGSGRRCHRH